MENNTTQFDKRLSEYKDRLLQRNKEMTTDDDAIIDRIINASESGKEQQENRTVEKQDIPADAYETPPVVSDSYREYADKLEDVLKEVGVGAAPEKKKTPEKKTIPGREAALTGKASHEKRKTEPSNEVVSSDDEDFMEESGGMELKIPFHGRKRTPETEKAERQIASADERQNRKYSKRPKVSEDLDDADDTPNEYIEDEEEDESAASEMFRNLKDSLKHTVSSAGDAIKNRKTQGGPQSRGPKKPFRLNSLGKWSLAGIILLIAFIIVTACYISANKAYKYNQMDIRPIDEKDVVINDGVEAATKGYTTIALYGVDSRETNLNEGTNSDTIILVNINDETKEVKLVSVYRDTLVKIQHSSEVTQKVNYAYQLGGALMSINTLNANLDLDITDYITVDFNAMAEIINALGGVEVTIEEDEINSLNKNLAEQIGISGKYSDGVHEAGAQVLNGQQAVAYTRIRSNAKGDITRTERQRTVLLALIDKMISADSTTIANLIDVSFDCISTSFSKDEIEKLAKDIADYKVTGNTGFPFAYDFATLAEKGNVIAAADMNANITALHEYLYGNTAYTPSDNASSISAELSSETGVASVGNIDVSTVTAENGADDGKQNDGGDDAAGTGDASSDVNTLTSPPEGMIENE